MPTFKTEDLISQLIEQSRKQLNSVEVLLHQPLALLQYHPAEGQWSILECIEHLNIYSRYYNTELKKRLQANTPKATPSFKSGRLGNYFVQVIQPKERLNKMKTPKAMNPIDQTLDQSTLEEFKEHLLDLFKKPFRANH